MADGGAGWIPEIAERSGPRYRAIVDAIAEAIETGALRPGDRLPTHRDMAWHLGVNVSTITEAYREAARRHLVVGEVGRGTYVRAGSLEAGLFALAASAERAPVDLSTNVPAENHTAPGVEEALADLARDGGLAGALAYPGAVLLERARAAAATMLASRGVDPKSGVVHLVAGAQQALLATLMCLVGPGDKVLVEEMTFPGIKAVARTLGITLIPVAMDQEGMLPDALAREARRSGAKVAVLVPNLQNPTAAVMGNLRRRDIVVTAERLGLMLIEDDVYGALTDHPPLLAEDTDRVVLLSSLSKTAAPGLRFGWIAGPAARLAPLDPEAHATTWMMSPLTLMLACRLIEDGRVDERTAWQRKEVAARHRLAMRILGGTEPESAPALHHWLPLADGDAVARRAHDHGVSVVPASTFTVGRGSFDGIRICLTAPPTRAVLRGALTTLSNLL
ncbi:MAG: PLP-dependent aminotransferase family protein [Hyphomicrobiales bacterium]|nr:MAG: PLP-dependent aminotransferase family protein [Hyphomicrobiales bacterium]